MSCRVAGDGLLLGRTRPEASAMLRTAALPAWPPPSSAGSGASRVHRPPSSVRQWSRAGWPPRGL